MADQLIESITMQGTQKLQETDTYKALQVYDGLGYRLTLCLQSKSLNEFGKLLEIDIELKRLVLTGVLHCSTNTMGIKTIEFASPVRDIENKTKMLFPEGGTTLLTITPGRKSKSNSYLTVCMLKVKIRGKQMLMTSWQSVFSNSSLGYLVKVKNT